LNNIGGGKLTFAVPGLVTGTGGSVVVTASSGVAPGTLTFTLDPGRSGVVRTPGTNMFVVTGANAATNTGNAINVVLASNDAINVPPVIRVYMNYRDSTMRGVIYPVATVPNSTLASCLATSITPCYEGLQDIVLDEARGKVYITNSGYNRVEVFDTKNLAFQTPIPVGQLPHQMAMSLDGSQLYVANTGGESISIVDLDQQQVVGSIQFPPIPRAGNAKVISVSGMAMGLSGLQLVLKDGTLWDVVGNQAVPRVGTSVTGVNTNGTQIAITATPNSPAMLASDDGTSLILLGANGTAYVYDGLADAYTSSNRLFSGTINGYFGILGAAPSASFLLANALVTNRSLSPIGGYTSVGSTVITPPTGPGGVPGIGISTTGVRNVAAVAPVGSSAFVRMTTAVRTALTIATSDDVHTTLEAVDVKTGATAIAARMPENPVLPEFALQRIQMPPRQMVVDSNGTVYAVTLSGLSVVPLSPATSATQPQIAAAGGVINAISPTAAIKPGSFITIKGTGLASAATASTLPPPTLLGGSCVLVGDVAIPLLTTAPNQISAQIPANASPGVQVLQVRSLSMAQQSQRVVVTIQKP
jgi:YVTN family beta-propeller protein